MKESVIYQDWLAQGRRQGQVSLILHLLKRRIGEIKSEDLISDDSDFPNDSDGSAKVALIGVDRSILAWSALSSYFSDNKKEIINIIVLLENLRKRIELKFPNARDFKRPGFDD